MNEMVIMESEWIKSQRNHRLVIKSREYSDWVAIIKMNNRMTEMIVNELEKHNKTKKEIKVP